MSGVIQRVRKRCKCCGKSDFGVGLGQDTNRLTGEVVKSKAYYCKYCGYTEVVECG